MSSMFGSPPKPPPVTPPPVMPDPMSPDVRAAKLRTIAEGDMRGGRQSTVVTTKENRTLAGGNPDARKL